jgi:hypothetical protein
MSNSLTEESHFGIAASAHFLAVTACKPIQTFQQYCYDKM